MIIIIAKYIIKIKEVNKILLDIDIIPWVVNINLSNSLAKKYVGAKGYLTMKV